ncbi:uncharacterized protein [Argopecten irradians]|uniref:uncharacterized protein n=1 Tax=Argopecten irradians TaxID=31199 RepID=UPI00371F08F7
MGNQNVKGHHLWPTSCMPGINRNIDPDVPLPSSGSEDEGDVDNATWRELENAVVNNDGECLDQLINCGANINTPLNEKGETALILSVKLTHLQLVRILLAQTLCKKNCLNVNNCSALDLAIVTAFDNRLEPRHTMAWQIIKCLMEANSEPVCKDAMMYVIRTALKYSDELFLYRLIQAAIDCSKSFKFHELLLQKLHRHQPIYLDSIDPLLMNASDFSVKLVRYGLPTDLEYVVNSFMYYLESYWDSKENKNSVLQKLILYATAAGWSWSQQQVSHIHQVNPAVGSWCSRQLTQPLSLGHLARKTFRTCLSTDISVAISSLPFQLPESLKLYLILKDIDEILNSRIPMKEIFL